jgi:hypothetical protein
MIQAYGKQATYTHFLAIKLLYLINLFIRLSCAYHLVPASTSLECHTSSSSSSCVAQYILSTNNDEVKADVIHDRYVLECYNNVAFLYHFIFTNENVH